MPESYDQRQAREAYQAVVERDRSKATDEPLNDDGRHFVDGMYCDLTQCHHGDTGEYRNDADGRIIAALWNAWRLGLLELKPAEQ